MPFPFHPFDLAYGLGLVVTAPVWLVLPKLRRKVLPALRGRMARDLQGPASGRGPALGREGSAGRTVLIHAVSLGEVNATRSLVTELRAADPNGLRIVVSATSAAGFNRATELYDREPGMNVARYPLDFTPAVTRFLDHYRPDVVVLMELELWPNFLRLCRWRGVGVVLINGRLTGHSFRRYRLVGPIARRMLRSLRRVCVQDETYRERFIALGSDPARTVVTGTMKFDTAQLSADPAKVAELRGAMGVGEQERVLVAGSTGPGEEAAVLRAYRSLLGRHPDLRLAIVPRQPGRFDEAAGLIRAEGFPVVRRSERLVGGAEAVRSPEAMSEAKPVLLGDTLGELRNFFALATVVVVGRTLVDLGPKQHGSDMLEPAALGKPVIVGPFTGNFADAMRHLRLHDAIVEVAGPEGVEAAVERLLLDPPAARALSERAAGAVIAGRGATGRHVGEILRCFEGVAGS